MYQSGQKLNFHCVSFLSFFSLFTWNTNNLCYGIKEFFTKINVSLSLSLSVNRPLTVYQSHVIKNTSKHPWVDINIIHDHLYNKII